MDVHIQASDVTVASANIVDGTIVNADVNASAAIAGIAEISPDFGSQAIQTTGNLVETDSNDYAFNNIIQIQIIMKIYNYMQQLGLLLLLQILQPDILWNWKLRYWY